MAGRGIAPTREGDVWSPDAAPAPPKVSPVLTSTWGRLLIPSLSDLFFIATVVWLFCLGHGWQGLLEDADTGWHIRTGQFILSTHTVPTKDLFSFSKANEPWYAWEWLSDVIYGGLFNWLGMKGVVLFAGLLIAGSIVIILRRTIWDGSNPFIGIAVSLLIVGASSIHYHARPHAVTLLLFPLCLWMIDADRRRQTRWIWLLIPITIVWTNMHGAFLALIACLGLLVFGAAVEGFLSWRKDGVIPWRDPARYALLLAACSAATLVNPYGYQLHVHIAEYLGSDWIREVVNEFQSPNFSWEAIKQYEVLLFAGLATSAALLARRRVVEALWILYWAHMSLASVRHVPLFVLVAAPYVASEATRLWQIATVGKSRKSLLGIFADISRDTGPSFQRTTVWVAVFVAALFLLNEPFQWPKDFAEEKFPVKLVAQRAEWLTTGRLLTTDQWGDYLIYKFYPNVKVFVDGRSDFYGPSVGKQYLALMQADYTWESVLKRNRFNKIMVPVAWPLVSLIKQSRDWRIVADDGKVVLFERNTSPQSD